MFPILFKLPFGAGFPIFSYGVMLGLSFVVGWYLSLGLAKRDGLPLEPLKNCYVITAVSAVVGSRLLYVATNLEEFDTFASVIEFRSGGMVAYGGFLGGFVGSVIYLAFRRFPITIWADVAVPSLASGLFITRIGCYLFGCDFGRPLAEGAPAWLVKAGSFPRWPDDSPAGAGSPAFYHHVDTLGLDPEAAHSLPVHPTQLYESALGLGLLALLFFVRKHQTFRGQVFFTFTFVYGLGRFLLEFLRDDLERGDVGPGLPAQILYPLSFAIFAISFSVGLAELVRHRGAKLALQIASFVPAVIAYVKFAPAPFETVPKLLLSTSQALGLGSAMVAMVAFALFIHSARRAGAGAMALPDLSHLADPEDDEPAPAKKSPARKPLPRKPVKAVAVEPASEPEEAAEAEREDDASPTPPDATKESEASDETPAPVADAAPKPVKKKKRRAKSEE